MPKFSIIIPVYNVAPYLRECLDSVLAQTFTDWEAICVDDGSTDGSGAILDEFVARDGRFRVIHQKNAGVSAARNVALEKMRGEWFLFLDGDDMFRPDALEHFFEVISGNNCDAILMQPYLEHLKRDEVTRTEPFSVIQRMGNGIHLMTGDLSANGFPFGRVYKSCKFRSLRFEPGIGMSEDVLFWSQAIGIPANWIAVKGSYYYYRQRADSACRQYDFNRYRQIIDVNLRVLRQLLVYDPSGAGLKAYWQRYRWSCEQVKYAFANWKKYSVDQKRKIFSYQDSVKALVYRTPFSVDFRLEFLLHRANLHCLYRPVMFSFRVVRAISRRTKALLRGMTK